MPRKGGAQNCRAHAALKQLMRPVAEAKPLARLLCGSSLHVVDELLELRVGRKGRLGLVQHSPDLDFPARARIGRSSADEVRSKSAG